MRRVDFFRHLIGLAGIGLPAISFPEKKPASVEVYDGWIAGFIYYDGPDVIGELRSEQPLQLRREPDNPYDHRAIEVYAGKHKLGYIPQADNKVLSRMMDEGAELQARVSGINRRGGSRMVGVELALK